VIARAVAEAVFADVIRACDPARRVREALGDPAIAARLAGRPRYAIAIGKAARAMASGAGEVIDGIAVVPAGAGAAPTQATRSAPRPGSDAPAGPEAGLPAGWRVIEAAHPVPDARSVAAGRALEAFMQARQASDGVLALVSGGASALAELPIIALDDFVAVIRAVMAAGAPIDEINAVRGALSAIKAGQLALASAAPVVTLAVSDVIGDPLDVIGSGPTVGPWLAARVAAPSAPAAGSGAPAAAPAVDDGAATRRARARAVLARYGIAAPAILGADLPAHAVVRADHAAVIAPMASAAHAAVAALAARGIAAEWRAEPIAGDVADVARALAGQATAGAIVAWGEPTLRVPDRHGEGGRAQQLALALAGLLRGGDRSALVVGSDGIDGPRPAGRPAPAGAWIDGTTWAAIAAAGIDPAAALAACDAGTALAAAGALVVTGPSGINHADLVILG
jgi:hydroxypyruvate reductase